MGLMALLLHLTSLRSFGVSYMSPFGPYVQSDMKDTIFRLPCTMDDYTSEYESSSEYDPANTPEKAGG